MKFNQLTYKNIRYFFRYYKLISVAVIITVAVITGSLITGDSVRTTLVKRVTERLGDTETLIFSRNSFMDKEIMNTPLFKETGTGVLLTNGFVSHNGRFIPVFVWGRDDLDIAPRSARINQALARELSIDNSNTLVLRLPAIGLVPSGSLFVSESYTTSLRLSCEGIMDKEEGGNIHLKNEQIIPFNIFVNQNELTEALEIENKINLILASGQIPESDFKQTWGWPVSGLSVNRKTDFTEIISDRVFLQKEVIESVIHNNTAPNRLFSYLANSITLEENSIPYSFITAMDRYKEEAILPDEVILSDYSANRLNARKGDLITITYYTSENLKTLKEKTVTLRIKQIVPLAELMEDKGLSAEFPGLSNVDRCTEWDSDLPIDMDRITEEDERYWELYRNTPKAIIAYDAVASDWGNAYGWATAIRVANTEPDLSNLQPSQFGIQVIHPREQGLQAAKSGVDFAGLFLALSFFIIISAMLLMQSPLSEMLYQRRHELSTLKALGYSRKRLTALLWTESAPIILLSAIVGVLGGLLFTALIMFLLGNVWKGITQTEGFSVYPDIVTILIGFIVGISLSLLLLRQAITKSLNEKLPDMKPRPLQLEKKKIVVILSSVFSIVLIGYSFLMLHSVVLFVIAGIVFMCTATIWGDYLICKNSLDNVTAFTFGSLKWETLYAGRKQAIRSFIALAIGVFTVFSVGLNRKGFADSSQIKSGTGGYSLWGESSVAIYHNMSTPEGREKLSLRALPEQTEFLQCLRLNADDASCLNLNKVSTPSVLGIDMNALAKSDFQIEKNRYGIKEKEAVFKQLQTVNDTVYPALIDATVLTWGLAMNIGDTLFYESDKGKQVAIQIAGVLMNSVFQGNILIDQRFFSEIWKKTKGSEVFLVKIPEEAKEETRQLLSQALSEYGVRITTTNERLKQFNVVTDTYLTIFMTLGGLGLLIGIMSFIIVIRKNLAMRREEIILYRTLGFTDSRITETLYRENLLVPVYAILTGMISAIIGVGVNFTNTGLPVWLLALVFTFFFIMCVRIFIKRLVKQEVRLNVLNR